MVAAKCTVATFVNALASTLDTPAHRMADSGLSRVLWELGCRESPLRDEHGRGGFNIRDQMEALDQEDVIDRPIWALAYMFDGDLRIIHHVPETSPLHPSNWPGYPYGSMGGSTYGTESSGESGRLTAPRAAIAEAS